MMQSDISNKNQNHIHSIHDFGNSLQDLVISYWVYFPFKVILSLGLSAFLPLIVSSGNALSSLDDYGVVFALIIGGGFLLFGFPAMIRYLKFVLKMRSVGKSLENRQFKKASQYELIRMYLMGLMFLLGVAMTIIIVQLVEGSRVVYSSWSMRQPTISISRIISLIVVGLLFLLILLVNKIVSILSILELNHWAKIQLHAHFRDENVHVMVSGLNLMRLGAIITFLIVPLGDALYNIGVARTAKSLQQYNHPPCDLSNSDEYSDSSRSQPEKSSIPMPIPNVQENFTQKKFCQCCGLPKRDTSVRFCSNCGEFFRGKEKSVPAE